ncbi:MAG: YdcF family protein [Thermosynechococcaceae cyanobacterium]
MTLWSTKFRLGLVSLSLLLGGLSWQQQPVTHPQAILVLGGAPQRERFAAKFAQQHPSLPLWVSGGSNPEYAEWVFQNAGIPEQRVHLDYKAVDTLTNFTTLVDQFKADGINDVYLITSDYHMRRAQWIGQFILGSRGIRFQSIAIPTKLESEPLQTAVFDGGRALLWVATGQTGESLKPMLQLQGMSLEHKVRP